MKTSDKILIYFVFTVIFAIAVMIVTMRFIISRKNITIASQFQSAGLITKDFDIAGFSSISVSGAWEVEIVKGDANQYQIQVTLPENESDNLDLNKYGDLLTIKYKNDIFKYFERVSHKIKIILPKLNRIDLNGGTQTEFSGFQSERMNVNISGDCKLRGIGNNIGKFFINSSGASRIELGNSIVTNADVQISGNGFIELNMAGGELTGNASGAVTIVYSGYISRQDIRQSGVVSIVKR